MQDDRRPIANDARLTASRHVLTVNGRSVAVEAAPGTRLLYVLRNDLALNGPKYGCGLGQCGSCTVLVDGRALRSCAIPLRAAVGRRITTLEGLTPDGLGEAGRLHPVQEAFIAENAAQCGYCLNGMIMTTVALLSANPDPSEAEIRSSLQGNLCRCGTHIEILRAVRAAAMRMRAHSRGDEA
ncbi:(2Fe-2S)-binding protein [Methylobacterium currus]|uniref:(2Fe-2S)-binding protein n=1 Tax=Methylobacterium currus TaxID=2051553 RepID=A0A2R4WVG6_9HYPH|nr:(2Fe-2S)-binding protein [Methylobacterium currus]AWB25534.1 (2Fe-2S)-binding protein [Methylobacterium currus]UHC19668.1 (2Fe-2S)-binding protein [Methylobacterium currus]